MKVTNLRFYDEALHKRLKLQAVKEETTLQSLIIKACELYLTQVENQAKK